MVLDLFLISLVISGVFEDKFVMIWKGVLDSV